MEVKRILSDDDLDSLVADINSAQWDAANEISLYDVDALHAYLNRQDTVFMACYDNAGGTSILMGIASSRIEIKPYDHELWLYVDEVDVCADHRQKGAGKLIMKTLIQFAEDNNCEELWLGTEVDNAPANALYRSLAPDDVADVVGYTYETDA